MTRIGSPAVIVILGSPADLPWAERITAGLHSLGIIWQIRVASAHKTPVHLMELLRELEAEDSPRVYITVAGRSNALSGFVDAQVVSPVIACPPPSDAFGGMDLLSSVRMPRGVAPLLVLDPENAALAAAKVLALALPRVRGAISRAQASERARVIDADKSQQDEPAKETEGVA